MTLCINPQCPAPSNAAESERCQGCGARLCLGQRFRPTQVLGEGGFGRTFLAWDEAVTPPQRYVIKQILRSRGSREQDLAEAKRLAQLGQHPQIPSLIAILESSRDLCLVQTYVAGRTLAQRVETDGPLTEKDVRSLLLALLPVLQFIHDQKIIHRDIKPENVLLPEGDGLPVLVDFGAARPVPTASELEQTGTIIGSAGYAAPEQALGKAVPASDLYSLGLTGLYLLTGVHPFDLYSVAEDRWVWQTLTPVPVSDALARVLNRLTARALRSRYPTATAALADLAPAGLIPQRRVTSNLVKRPPNPWRCTQIWPTSGRVVNALAIAPTGQAIAAANSDGTVQLWDYQTGEVLHTFAQRLGFGEGHRDAATAVTFHPDGQTLFSASQDGTVKQWNLDRYRQRQSLQQPGWQVTTIALTPDGAQLIAAETTGRISLWQISEGKRLVDLTRHSGAVNQVQVSPLGDRLVSVGEAGTLRLWALPTGQLLHTWTVQTGLRVVALNAMVPAVVPGDRRGAVMLWSLTDFAQHQQLGQHQDAVSAIALSPNGRWLATGSRDREIHLWDWGGEIPQRCAVLRHDWAVCDLVFTPDSQTLISGAADETIRFWQAVADG